jgi:uncharacterized lipoprotein YehR (DUF1307 family)
MKKMLLAVFVVIALSGCGRFENMWSGFKSATGIMTRTVTLYNAQGAVIKTWVTDNEVHYEGPVAKFIDKNGITVRVSGTFIVEGK